MKNTITVTINEVCNDSPARVFHHKTTDVVEFKHCMEAISKAVKKFYGKRASFWEDLGFTHASSINGQVVVPMRGGGFNCISGLAYITLKLNGSRINRHCLTLA